MSTTHGHSMPGSPGYATYITWMSMKARCQSRNHKSFGNYGSRGITVCERWQSFEAFLEDMGFKPSGLSLDRIDNSKGYYKENCRWTTYKVQARNRRNNRMIAVDGVVKPLVEWAQLNNLTHDAVWHRIASGWDESRAVTVPMKPDRRRAARAD